jgi:hypothetical protein
LHKVELGAREARLPFEVDTPVTLLGVLDTGSLGGLGLVKPISASRSTEVQLWPPSSSLPCPGWQPFSPQASLVHRFDEIDHMGGIHFCWDDL